jgi:hypothetical protein
VQINCIIGLIQPRLCSNESFDQLLFITLLSFHINLALICFSLSLKVSYHDEGVKNLNKWYSPFSTPPKRGKGVWVNPVPK